MFLYQLCDFVVEIECSENYSNNFDFSLHLNQFLAHKKRVHFAGYVRACIVVVLMVKHLQLVLIVKYFQLPYLRVDKSHFFT